jgi:hypothetical protein
MHGDLATRSAADVCRELAVRSASGLLAIEGPQGPGSVGFEDGRIIAARAPVLSLRLGDRLVGAGELDDADLYRVLDEQEHGGSNQPLGALLVARGLVTEDVVRRFVQEQVLDALFVLLGWREGGFSFTDGRPPGSPAVSFALDVDEALVEVARRRQQWDELTRVIPDLACVPSFRDSAALASASLEPDEFAVLASVDGHRSIRDLAADLGYGEFEVARIVYGLTLLGIVEVANPEDPVGRALDDALTAGDAGDGAPDVTDAAETTTGPDAGVPAGSPGRRPLDPDTSRALAATLRELATSDPAGATPPAPADEPEDEGLVVEADLDDLEGEPGEPEPPAPSSPRSPSGGEDVSEFLRELSRLALAEDPAPAGPREPRPGDPDQEAPPASGSTPPSTPRSQPAPGPRPTSSGSGKRKRRGLFGRG